MYIRSLVGGFLAMLLALAMPAQATDSYARFYGSLEGLRAGEIAALAQDDAGFIWIGSQGGLICFDGEHFLPFGGRQIPLGVTGLWWDTHTGLLIQTEQRKALLEKDGTVTPFAGPNGQALTDMRSAAFDARGNLWTIVGRTVWRRDLAARWQEIPGTRFGGEQPLRLMALETGVALMTDRGAWRLNADGHAQLLLHSPDLFAAAGGGTHPLWLADHADGNLWRARAGRFVPFTHIRGRVLDMRYRGDTLWVSVDRYLLAVASDGRMSRIDVKHGLLSGGPLLIDHEGSLWVGTFVGLQQYPEPDTQHWGELDGLPWQHAYAVAYVAHQVWISTWGGPVRFDTRDPALQMHRVKKNYTFGVLCGDRESRLWYAAAPGLLYWRDGHSNLVHAVGSPQLGLGGCMPAKDGGEWLATNLGVFHANARTASVERVRHLNAPDPNYFTDHAWQADDGTLWVTSKNTLCHYDLNDFRARLHSCRMHLFNGGVTRVQQIAPGRYWLSSNTGLFEFDGRSLQLLPGNQLLPGRRFRTIEPAMSGGYWAIGPGALDRIRPCNDCAAGFRILESVEPWQGVPGDSALDIVELPSGDLWIAGNRGVFRVPAAARAGPHAAPHVQLVEANVDNAPADIGVPLRLQPAQKELQLIFAALTFRDRSLLRYRYRTALDAAWSSPTTNSELELVRPRPGDYRIAAEASLDGVHWSAPAVYVFSVAPAWFETWWARLVAVLLFLLLCAGAARLWLEYRLRLERQRVRIAMDLHDELGSGLGAIGMLAGALTQDGAGESERRRLLGDIGESVARLGGALRTVVWTLRQPNADMRRLFTEISDQARHLFPGPCPVLRITHEPPAAPMAVTPEVRRHVLMIVLEALHNAARHAHAHEISLRMQRQSGDDWRIEMRDDGTGFDLGANGCGNGLDSMRRRARLIGAELTVYSEPGAGTTVKLDFHPQGQRHA